MKRPNIKINIAMTADGKIDTYKRQGAKISSESDWRRVDQLRSESDGVMVGGKTLIAEDPRLTVKDSELRANRVLKGLDENPAKVGVISNATIPVNGRFVKDGNARVILFTTNQTPPEQLENLVGEGVEVFVVGENRVDLPKMMAILYKNQITDILVEGGGTLNAALIQAKFVDEIIIYVAPIIFGGADAPTLSDGLGFLRDKAILLQPISVSQTEDGGVILHYMVIN